MERKVQLPEKHISEKREGSTARMIVPVLGFILILVIMVGYTHLQKVTVVRNAEVVASDTAEHITNEIESKINYATSSIKLTAATIEQTMTSETLENPSEVLLPMIENTPFGGIEYIRADGMNVMNIGQPFDASDRVYYQEGIKGNTGIWNNYHPKLAQETLINFYTPLSYEGKISGVITGYILADSQVKPLLESQFYGEPVYGLLIDENDMVICNTSGVEFEKNLTLDTFLSRFNVSEEKKEEAISIFENETKSTIVFNDLEGEGRVCIRTIPETGWKVIVIIPSSSFNTIVNENTRNSVITIVIVAVILIAYATYVLTENAKRRKEIAEENKKLEEDNRLFNEANLRAFAEISNIRDIIASANMGTWKIELVDEEAPRMYIDETMGKLLGTDGQERTPEQNYTDWFHNIKPEAVASVLSSVERMQQGYFDENTYQWIHPTKGVRYVRCGGTAKKIPGGYSLQGYHYDVDEVVREQQKQMVLLQEALDEKNDYYSTLGALGDIFYSLHVLNLKEDTVIEFNAKGLVKELVNHQDGASAMMAQVMKAATTEEYIKEALKFTNLSTLAKRMKNKMIISKQFVGKNLGWYIASFITLEKDDEGKPTKVIFATRDIDEEKRQEENLIHKTQTDELTGALNRRAYEENIYEHNDLPEEEEYIYISLDVNGLKVVNDTLGHTAGDELIIGAAQCMKKCFAPYGKIFRIGGDEFVAILYCDKKRVIEILQDFDATISNWKGELVDKLSISYGWISKEEDESASVRKLGAIAEKRMYEAKSAHYRKSGVDRRGQQDAHKALCELYTKILRINITEDSYQIVNMDTTELASEKSLSDKISEWLVDFGKSGKVHPDDLDEYLKLTDLQYMREYFAGNKTSLHIFYRRRYEDEFKQTLMEIIPSNDYSNENQSLFLYVKEIDK